MNKLIILTCAVVLLSFKIVCAQVSSEDSPLQKVNNDRIQVLNFATFHMRSTTDAMSVDFDEKDAKNQEDARDVAAMIAKFEPTIICVEIEPDQEDDLNTQYLAYVETPSQGDSYNGEVRLVAFEVGRLADVPKIYAIDHKMDYNYAIGGQFKNSLDSSTIQDFYSNPFKYYPIRALGFDG